jgi:predicted RNase H-like HicB family nuclease
MKLLTVIKFMKLKVIVHEEAEGGFWAEVPALPGCMTQGETWEELIANIQEAVEGCLETIAERNSNKVAKLTEITI